MKNSEVKERGNFGLNSVIQLLYVDSFWGVLLEIKEPRIEL
jgi:hypothetical protein